MSVQRNSIGVIFTVAAWMSGLLLTDAKDGPAIDATPAKPIVVSDLKGNWLGTIDAGVIKLRLGFVIKGMELQKLEAKLFSIDQGNAEIPVDSIKVEDVKVSMALPRIGGTFEGNWRSESGEIVGTWKQGPQSFPITLKKVELLPTGKRPQKPKKPYPYLEEDVTFTNLKQNVTLRGTMTVPKGSGPFPAVVLISGSGPQDRNEEIAGHQPFLVLSDMLTRRGIAVLRYDDRDFGKPAEANQATSEELSEDVLAGVNYLRSRPEIVASKIGLIGHSEGGMIAPMLASRHKDIAFVVMIAGPGLSGESIIIQQQMTLRTHFEKDKTSPDEFRATWKTLIEIMTTEPDGAEALKKIEAALETISPESDTQTKDAIKTGAKTLLTPWFRYFVAYDPKPALTKVTCPVLAIIGEKDFQVEPRENLPIIEAALKEGGNKDFLVKELSGLNHLLQPCTTGMLDEYAVIEITIAPEALKLIGDWIVERTSK